MPKGVPIGLTNLVYAILESDTAPEGTSPGAAVYDESVRVLGAITANFSPNASNDTLFADDGPYETASTLGAMTLELNVADLPPVNRAELLGATYDVNTGLLIHTADDIPPYVAVGMSVKKSNGASRLIWYLKGKFSAPDDNNQTKAESINWNTPTISGNFLKRDADNQWRVSAETDDTNVPEAIKASWFVSPNVAGSALFYKVTLVGGMLGAGTYAAGATVYIEAPNANAAGKAFKSWEADPSADVTLDNENARITSFAMPENNVTITATFEA